MALKIREEALRKRRIQADFAQWAKRLKPSIPVAGGPRPTGVVQRAVPTEVLEREAPAVTRDVSPAERAAQARPEIILPGPLLQEGPEEPEEAPVGAVPLSEVEPRQLAQDLAAVQEEPDKGALEYWAPVADLVTRERVAQENVPAAIAVVLSIMHARSGGRPDHVLGDSVGLFGMSAREKPRVEYDLIRRKELDPDVGMSSEDFLEWRLDPNNQLAYYTPLIVHYVQIGLQRGLPLADLAVFVGDRIQVPGATVQADYKQALSIVWSQAQEWVQEVSGGNLSDALRQTPYVDGKVDGKATGLPPYVQELREVVGPDGKIITLPMGFRKPGEADIPVEDLVDLGGSVQLPGDKGAFPTREPREWIWSENLWNSVKHLFNLPRQWVGVHWNHANETGDRRKQLAMIEAGWAKDRVLSAVGAPLTLLWAVAGRGIGGAFPFFTKMYLDVWDRDRYSFLKTEGKETYLERAGEHWGEWMRGIGASVERAGEIYIPDYPGAPPRTERPEEPFATWKSGGMPASPEDDENKLFSWKKKLEERSELVAALREADREEFKAIKKSQSGEYRDSIFELQHLLRFIGVRNPLRSRGEDAITEMWRSLFRKDLLIIDDADPTADPLFSRGKPKSVLRGTKAFKTFGIPGSSNWSSEKIDEAWDKGKDFQYTWMFDKSAEEEYLAARDAVEGQINWLRAQKIDPKTGQPYPPRRMDYYEIEELQKRYSNPYTEMAGEAILDLGWLLDKPMGWAFKTFLKPVAVAGWRPIHKALIHKWSPIAPLITTSVKHSGIRVGGATKETLDDFASALNPKVWEGVPGFKKPDGSSLSAEELLRSQHQHAGDTTLTKAELAYRLSNMEGIIYNPLTGEEIILKADAAVKPGQTPIGAILAARIHEFGMGGGVKAVGARWVDTGVLTGKEKAWRTGTKMADKEWFGQEWAAKKWKKKVAQSMPARFKHLADIFKYSALRGTDTTLTDHFFTLLRQTAEEVAGSYNITERAAGAWEKLSIASRERLIYEEFKNKHVVPEFLRRHGIAQGPRGKAFYYNHIDGTQIFVAETNRFLGEAPAYLKRLWIEANLSARPGFTIRNILDSYWRMHLAGGWGSHRKTVKQLIADTFYPEQVTSAFAAHELGAHVQVFLKRKRLPRFWSGKDWLEALADVSEQAAYDAAQTSVSRSAMSRFPVPYIGRKQRGFFRQEFRKKLKNIDTGELEERYLNLSLSTFMEMARDWNEMFEILARMRLYDNFFHHTYEELRKHYARHFFTRMPEDTSDRLRKTLEMALAYRDKNAQTVLPWLEKILTDEGVMVDVMVPPEMILKFLNPPERLRNTKFFNEGWGEDIAEDLTQGLYHTWVEKGELNEAQVLKLFDDVEERLKDKLEQAYLEELHEQTVTKGKDGTTIVQDNMNLGESPKTKPDREIRTNDPPDPTEGERFTEQGEGVADLGEETANRQRTYEVSGRESYISNQIDEINAHMDSMSGIKNWIDRLFIEDGPGDFVQTLENKRTGFFLRKGVGLINWSNIKFRDWLDYFPNPGHDVIKKGLSFARRWTDGEAGRKSWVQQQKIMTMVQAKLDDKYKEINDELQRRLVQSMNSKTPLDESVLQDYLYNEIEKLSTTEGWLDVVLGKQGHGDDGYWDTLGNIPSATEGKMLNEVLGDIFAKRVHMGDPGKTAEKFKNRLGFIKIVAYFNEEGKYIRGPVRRFPAAQDVILELRVDPSVTGDKIGKAAAEDAIQSFTSLSVLTSGTLERASTRPGVNLLTGAGGWLTTTKKGDRSYKNGLFPLFDDTRLKDIQAAEEAGERVWILDTEAQDYVDVFDEDLAKKQFFDESHSNINQTPEVPPDVEEGRKAVQTGDVEQGPTNQQIEASAIGVNATGTEISVFDKPRRGKDAVTDAELEYRISITYDLHGEFADGKTVVLDKEIREGIRLDEQELRNRYVSRAVRQGWDGITEHEQTILQLQELMAGAGNVVADTEALVLGKGSGAADLAVFNENLVKSVTWDEYFNDPASQLVPVELLGFEDKVSKIVRRHLTGERELTADVMVRLDKAGKAAKDAYTWDTLRALALLYGVDATPYKIGLAGHKRLLAEHIEAVTALDVLMKAEGVDRLKQWVAGNLEGLEDMKPFREVYKKLFPGGEIVPPGGLGGSASVGAELENDITMLQTLVWVYRQKVENQIVDRSLINYLDYGYKAVLNPEARDTLTSRVLMSYLFAERLAEARQGKGAVRGFSKFLTPKEQRSPIMRELFDKLDFHPQSFLSREQIKKGNWNIVRRDGDEFHFDTIEEAWQTVSEMAIQPRMEGEMDAGFRFGIKHSKAYGADTFTLYERSVDIATKTPYLLSWDDFLIWLRGNITDENRAKYGWKKWDVRDRTKFFSELSAIGGLVDSRSTAGMSADRLDAWKFAQDAREAVINKALKDGANVPVTYINQIEGMASHHLLRNNIAKANLFETIIPGPQGGALKYGEALKGVAKAGEGAKFVTLDDWEPIAEAFYKKDFAVEVEKLGSAFKNTPELRTVSPKQRELGRPVQYPDGVEAVLALNAAVINAESDLHLLRRVRTQINKYRGERTNRFLGYSDTLTERALRRIGGVEKEELLANAAHWETADDLFSRILTILDDKIYALDPQWHDNTLRLREAYKATLDDPTSALRRELDNIVDSQEGRKADPGRAGEQVRARTNKERPSYQDVERVLAALKDKAYAPGWTAKDLRTHVLAETLAGAASRIKRISNLAWKDVDVSAGEIWLRHKDFKSQTVSFKGGDRTGGTVYTLDPEAKKALKDWEQYCIDEWGPPNIGDETPVFTFIRDKEKWAGKKPVAITPGTLRNHLTGKNSLVAELFKGTDRTLKPHDFRRYFASKKFKHTFGDLKRTAELMNHKHPKYTVTYLLAMGHTIDELSGVISKSDYVIKSFASLKKVRAEIRKAVEAKQILDAQSVRVYRPHIRKANPRQVKEMRANWKKHLEIERSSDIKDLFKKGKEFAPRTSLNKRFFAEAARRSRGGTEDVRVIVKLLEALKDRRGEALKQNPFGNMNFAEDIVQGFLHELESLSPKRILDRAPILPEVAGPRRFEGFRLVNEKGEWIDGGPLYRDKAAASKAADVLRGLSGVKTIGYNEVPDYLEFSWREMLGSAYDNWRREKWLHYHDEILAHPEYAYIVSEGIEARNILLGPRGHTIGLEEFDPFKKGPLSYDRYLTELETNLAIPLDTAQVLPRNMVPNDSIQESGKNSGRWLKQVRENKEIEPISLPTVTIDKKEVPILMVTPNRGYRLVPLEEYGEARKWAPGHVSGFEGVKVKWQVPVAQGGKGKKAPAKTFVMTRDTHFFRPDEFAERITGEKWRSDVLVSGLEGTFNTGSELSRYVVGLVDMDDLKTNRVARGGRMVENKEFPSIFKGEEPVDPTGEIPYGVLEIQARHLDVNSLLETTESYGLGMPTVTADGVVIDGSGRVNMLKMARDASKEHWLTHPPEEKAQALARGWLAYQEAVKENLSRFNFSGEARERLRDITSLKNPVMVRILKDELSDYHVARIVRQANDPRVVGSPDMLKRMVAQDIETLDYSMISEAKQGIDDLSSLFMTRTLPDGRVIKAGSQGPSRALRDRYSRAMLVKLFGRADNESEVYRLANFAVRNNDKHTRTLIKGILDNFKGLSDLREEELAFLFKNIQGTMVLIERARTQFPTVDFAVIVETLASGESKTFSVFLEDNPVVLEMARLLARDANSVAPGEAVVGMFKEFAGEVKKATPDQVEKMVQVTLLGDTPEEILRNAIRNNTPEGEFDRAAREGVEHIRNRSDTASGLGPTEDTAQADVMAGPGRGTGEALEGTEEIRRIEANRIRYQAVDLGIYIDYEPEDMANYIELRDSMLASGTDKARAKVKMRRYTKKTNAQGMEPADVIVAEQIEALDQRIMETVVNLSDTNWDLYRAVDIGGTNRGEWKSLEDLANWFPSPDAEDKFQTGMEIWEEALRRYYKRLLEKEWTPAEVIAYNQIMDKVGGKRADRALPEMRAIVTEKGQHSYTTMRTYWKLVDDVLLNKSGMPSGVYSTWEKGPPGHFVYTPEGIALRNKVVAHIHQGGDNPGHVARAAELVTAEEAQLEQVLDQMHILARLWYAPAEARASGGMRRTGGEAIGNFGEVMGTGMLAGKAERAPSDAHNLMLEMLRQKRNGVGIGKNLAMEQQGKIMENLAGGVHFKEIRKKPKGLKEDVWNNLNEFNIASEIDEFFTHGAVQIPSKLDPNPLLDKYSFTTAKEMVDELNRWIRRGHDQMKPFYSQLSPEWRIARETPMKYDMNSEIPTRLLERLAFVRKNAQVKEEGAQRALEYYSGKKKLDNYLNTLQGIGGGGGGTLRDIEDVTPYEEMLEWLESIFKEWRITLLGNEGILGNKIQLTPAERDQLFAIVKNDIIPDTVNMQRAASIGTADELVFENTVTVGPANMPWDREADERFDAVLWEWGKENQLQKHDTEWFKRVLLDGDPDIEGFQITAKAQAAAVAKELKSEYVPIYGTLDAAEANIKKEFLARLDKKLEGLNNKAATMNWYKEELVARQGHQEEKAWRRGGRIVEGQPREAAAEVAFLEQRPDTEQIYDIAPGYFEQARDASPVYMELGLHNPFEKRSLGRPIVGAVERVGTAMVDYSNQNTLDQMMKWVFPFWVFPTRSMKFWAEQLITKPEILAASAKIGEMSERMSYDAGLITTSGHQLPRFSGYMNLGGGQWWVNPRAVSSYTQMVPHYRDVYVEDIDPEAGAAAQVMHFLNGTARYTGLYLAPWLSGPVRVAPLGILDEEAHMKSALFGQTSLLPPWAYRDVAQKVNGWGLKLMPEDFGIWGSPNVPWKDFLIQRDMLFKVLEEMENLDDFEKYQLSEEIKVEIATREGPRWEAARHDLEYDETYARILGYLSGIHQKQVRQGEAELYGIRDEIGALRKQISIDANNEAFYKEARYNTAEGNLYGIYQTIANVREGGEPDGRVLWGDERAMAIAEEIEQNRNFGAYLAAQAGLNRMATLALAEQPVGAPREVRDPIYQERLEGEKILKENFPDVGKYVWSPYNKNPETIRKHVTDKWMHMLKDMGLRPEWNSEDGVLWDEYQKQILAWEAQLPEIADVYIEELLARLAEEELNVDVPDEETGETTNMFLDLYGGTREAAKTKLLAMATGDQWNYWDVQNDSLYDALNRVYRDNYYGAYWDFVGDSSKSERRAKERQWDEMYPGGPSEMQILEWMDQVPAYQGKWTDGEILLHMTGRDPLDIEERIELRNTPRENRADDIFKWYGWAGPSGSEFLNAVSTIGGEDMKDALLDMFKSERKQLGDRGHWVHWNEEFFNRVYNAAHMAAQELGLTEPTDAQNAEWMQVEALDVQFAEYREKLYGPDWEGLQDRYFAMSPESRVEWRAENPEAWSDLQGGWDMKTPFGDYYPVWQKYRDSDRYKRRMGIATATTAGTGSYAGAGGGVSGGDTWTSPVGPGTWAGWTPGMTVAKVFAGAGGTGSVPRPWPRIRIPPDMMKEILSGSVSGGTTEYLEALRVQIEPFLTYEDFLERLRELGAAHGGEVTAGGEPAVEWPWLPGYEAPTAVL